MRILTIILLVFAILACSIDGKGNPTPQIIALILFGVACSISNIDAHIIKDKKRRDI